MAQRQFRSDDTVKWGERMGNGSDGDLVISSNTTFSAPNEGCSGTASTKTLTLASAGSFSNNDLILIHQTRGTSAGVWELNKILSGAGTTTLTLKYDLMNTYTDSGNNQAQALKLYQYSSVTVNTAVTWTAPAWDGSKGGIIAFLCKGDTNVVGSISLKGKGFLGGITVDGGSTAYNGESNSGVSTQSSSANGAGGGAGGSSAGAGGSNGGTGGTGGTNDQTVEPTSPVLGSYDSTKAFLGSGGGAGHDVSAGGDTAGGNGSGFLLLITKNLTITGTIVLNGGDVSTTAVNRPGGGGAAGHGLIKAENATLGTTLMTALAGAKGVRLNSWNGHPTDGTQGRLHLDYSKSYTGTTTPTLNTRNDATIIAGNPGAMFLLM